MDTILYYNMQSEGLGFEFAAEVKRTIGRMQTAITSLFSRKSFASLHRDIEGVLLQILVVFANETENW